MINQRLLTPVTSNNHQHQLKETFLDSIMNEVKLVSVSKPTVEGIDTAEDLIAYCARVSNPTNQLNTETSDKLLRYLVKHKHWSPFEMVHLTLEIKTTRDIARQILRHRSFSFQEFSQRYAEVDTTNFATREARTQDHSNRQNSIVSDDPDLKFGFVSLQSQVEQVASECYKEALKLGIAKEQARALLPEGLTMSTMYMAGSLRSWIHYCELRMGNGTQYEHQEVANQCWEIIVKEFPSIQNII